MSRINIGTYLWVLILLVAYVYPCTAHAQVKFERTYGGAWTDAAQCVQQTQDGGYIVAGGTWSFGGQGNLLIVKTDSVGDSMWMRTYGGHQYDLCYSVQQTLDSGYIVVGWTSSFGAGLEDIYLIKLDTQGDTMWTRTYGGGGNDRGYCVQETGDGCYIVAGWTSSFGAGLGDIYLIKLDTQGDTMWTRTYGGGGNDRGYCVQETGDGGFVITGYTDSFGVGGWDVYLVKTDSLGDSVWTRTFGGISHDLGYSVGQTFDGGYIITGHTYSFGAGEYDVYLIRTDSLVGTVWTKTYGGNGHDGGRSLQQTQDGGYIMGGWTNSFGADVGDVYLVKTDTLGDTLWTRTYGGFTMDYGNHVQQTQDRGYVIAGYTASFGAGMEDIYLIKTDENGLTAVQEERPAQEFRVPDIDLFQNTPNPFHHSTAISYSIPTPTQVTLTIYDITGRLVETLVNETQEPGIHQVQWFPESMPAAIYFCRLQAGEFVQTRKMLLVR